MWFDGEKRTINKAQKNKYKIIGPRNLSIREIMEFPIKIQENDRGFVKANSRAHEFRPKRIKIMFKNEEEGKGRKGER